jgi:hypothetical protein
MYAGAWVSNALVQVGACLRLVHAGHGEQRYLDTVEAGLGLAAALAPPGSDCPLAAAARMLAGLPLRQLLPPGG